MVDMGVGCLENRQVFRFHDANEGGLIEGRKDVADDLVVGHGDETMPLLLIEIIIGIKKIKGLRMLEKIGTGAGGAANLPHLGQIFDRGFADQDRFH